MFASASPKTSLSRLRSATLVAIMALPLGLGCAAAANAGFGSSVSGKEKSRVPVRYFASSNCSGTGISCFANFDPAPGGKKRLEIVGLSCNAAIYSGTVYRAQLQNPLWIIERLNPQYTGTYNDQKRFVMTSDTRHFADKKESLQFSVTSTGDIADLQCTLLGELVTYK